MIRPTAGQYDILLGVIKLYAGHGHVIWLSPTRTVQFNGRRRWLGVIFDGLHDLTLNLRERFAFSLR